MFAALLIGALSFTPLQEQVLEEALRCATSEPDYRPQDYYEACEGRVCRGNDGRPLLQRERVYDSPGGFFVIHYTMAGPETVPLTDSDDDGVPDYIEKVGDAFDRSLDAYREMGFVDPQPDSFGPDSRYDVYMSYLAGFGGVTWPDYDDEEGSRYAAYSYGTPSFIAINPQQHAAVLSIFPEWMADVLIDQVVSHELHHAVQMSYRWAYDTWVYEGMSVMMEQTVMDVPYLLPLITNYRYQPRYSAPDEGLLVPNNYGVPRLGYANGLFYQSLVSGMANGAGGYAAYWDAIGRTGEFTPQRSRVEQGLVAAGVGTLHEAFRKYAIRSLFLNTFDDGRQFHDGFRYHPQGGAIEMDVLEGPATITIPALMNFSYHAVRLEGLTGGVVDLTAGASMFPPFEADWVAQYANCSTSVTPVAFSGSDALIPVSSDALRGWLVIRMNGGAVFSETALAVDYAARPSRSHATGLELVRLPATAATGRAVPLVAKLRYSDCRVEDVSSRVEWSTEPADSASLEPGPRLFGHWNEPVSITASYGEQATSASVRFHGDKRPGAAAEPDPAGGCAQAEPGTLGSVLLVVGLWTFVRRVRRS